MKNFFFSRFHVTLDKSVVMKSEYGREQDAYIEPDKVILFVTEKVLKFIINMDYLADLFSVCRD